MTATLPFLPGAAPTQAPPQASPRVATGAAQPGPPHGGPDAPAGFQHLMQRAAVNAEDTSATTSPQPDGGAPAAEPLVTASPAQGDLLATPHPTRPTNTPTVLTTPSSPPDPALADTSEADPGPDAGTQLLWLAPPTPWVMSPLPPMQPPSLPASWPTATSGPGTRQAPLPSLGPAQPTPGTSIASSGLSDTAAAWQVGTQAPAVAADPRPWTRWQMALPLAQHDGTAAQATPSAIPPNDEAAPPAAASSHLFLPDASQLGPEAAAMRERSTAGPGPRAHELPAWLSSALPSLNAPPATEGAPHALLSALGERIETQLLRGSERTVIRLDPPMQGQIEITLHRDAAGLQVQFSASHGEVLKQLQAISDSLRQDLASRHGGEVSVQVAQQERRDADSRGRQPQDDTRPQQTPGQALREDSDDDHQTGFGQRLFSTFKRTSGLLS